MQPPNSTLPPNSSSVGISATQSRLLISTAASTTIHKRLHIAPPTVASA
ncbi:MAG: hypothetical protein Q4C79_09900 [Neisseria sp.]|nr:hypothetical protein [Neisseria sp.]MDO4249246.1 hypothetical protein [Neisseria sp.]